MLTARPRHTSAHTPCDVQLTASNMHGAHGPVAEAEEVVLGRPDAPTLLAGTAGINPGVGTLALAWTAPQTNAFIGTK